MDRIFVYESCLSFVYKRYFRDVFQIDNLRKCYVANYVLP